MGNAILKTVNKPTRFIVRPDFVNKLVIDCHVSPIFSVQMKCFMHYIRIKCVED